MLFGLNKRVAREEEVVLPDTGPFSAGCEEPSLREMLVDPLVHQVAKSDKIPPRKLLEDLVEVRNKLRQKTEH